MTRKSALVVMSLLVACKSRSAPKSEPPPDAKVETKVEIKVEAPPDAKAEHQVFQPPADPVQSAETWEKLYLQLAACGLDRTTPAAPCPEWDVLVAYDKSGTDSSSNDHWGDNMRTHMDVAQKLMTAENPTVRVAAIAEVHHLGGDSDAKNLVADAVVREQDPALHKTLAIMMSGVDYPTQKQIDLMFQLVDDPDPEMRRALVYALGEIEVLGTGANVPGAYEKVAEHLASDTDPEVRSNACEALGELGDPRGVKAVEAVLVDATPADLYDTCFEALIRMWSVSDTPVKAAYAKVLALIPKIERPLETLYAFRALEWEYTDEEEAKLHPFVKKKEIEKALMALAKNAKASLAAREAAVEKLEEMGVQAPPLPEPPE